MQFGFMSSVCPPLTLAELIDKAKQYDYKHLELRVEWDHGHGVELDATPQQLREARAQFVDSGIDLSCIATGGPIHRSGCQQTCRTGRTPQALYRSCGDDGCREYPYFRR